MTNDLKLKIYPAVIAILGLSLVALLLSRLEIQVSRESAPDDFVPPAVKPLPPVPQPEVTPSPSPKPLTQAEPPAIPSPSPSIAASPAPVNSEGSLRVSNQTSMPVRVALLYQKPESSATADSFKQPVHWDFAPEEGEAKGLILSLPDSNLRLVGGDVLVAFAQDGSRRYWGPYVVGKTTLPTWSQEQQEWSLVLRP